MSQQNDKTDQHNAESKSLDTQNNPGKENMEFFIEEVILSKTQGYSPIGKEREIICVLFFPLQIPIYFEFLVLTRYEFEMYRLYEFALISYGILEKAQQLNLVSGLEDRRPAI